MILSTGHMIFPRYFKWKDELVPLSLFNRQMMYIHTFFVAFGVLLMGILCTCSSHDLVNTELGRRVCLGFGIFWALRLYVQFFGFSSQLWRGKRFETIVHIWFVFLWTYLSFVFLGTYLMNGH